MGFNASIDALISRDEKYFPQNIQIKREIFLIIFILKNLKNYILKN